MQEISFPSKYGNGTQTGRVWVPADEKTGLHPCVVVMNGEGEVGKNASAGGSVGAQMRAGATLSAINGVYGGISTFYVLEIDKPFDGHGEIQPSRFQDGIDWALANLSNINPAQVYPLGLSLSAGAIVALMTNVSFKKAAAFVAVAPTSDAGDAALVAGIKATATPFRMYGSSTDENNQTRGAFTHYQAVADIVDKEKILYKYGSFIDLKTGHTGTWPIAFNFKTSDLFPWLLTKSRPELEVKPPVVTGGTGGGTTPVTPAVIWGTFGVYDEAGLLKFTVTIYNDGKTSTEYNKA
jgi:predicted peptidase